jgi:chromate transporter
MIYWQLFISFLKIGLLGFGGGMSIIALIEMEVEHYGWMSATEFVDIVGISQVTPGPIGLNCATYVGYTATGSVWGSLVASAGVILPSLVIMLIVCRVYMHIRDKWADNKVYQIVMRSIRVLIVGLIAVAAYRLCTPESFIDVWSYVICGVVAVCTLLPLFVKGKAVDVISHPIVLVVLSGLVGGLIYG